MNFWPSLTRRVVRPRVQCIAKKNANSFVFAKFNRLVFASLSDYATLLNAFVDRLGEVMTESNILPYDGQAILIDDHGAEFDWPAITRTLIDTIPWQIETARIFGREMSIPRMTAWFGDGAYSYSGILHLPAPFPAIIECLRERAEALSGALFNAALANLYRSGHDSVGWHSDNEAGLGDRPTIASLSLGGERRFQFRHRGTKQTITLGLRMGHWLIMAGETQRFWLHQVPKTASAVARVNLSFRHMIP
jgi:alkylated DNA repair dioxygenase AlkB